VGVKKVNIRSVELVEALDVPGFRHVATMVLGMVGAFVSLRRVLPDVYPLSHDVDYYIAGERRLGRVLD
jgi:hypothetical protein